MKNSELIRPEVMRYRHEQQYATVLITRTAMMRTFTGLTTLCLCLAMFVLVAIRYKETIPARGILESVNPAQQLYSPAIATVSQLFVAEGDLVEKGQPILTLSTEILDGDGRKQQGRAIEQLRLEAELTNRNYRVAEQLYTTSTRQLASKFLRTQTELEGVRGEASTAVQRLDLSKRNLEALDALLQRSNISKYQYDQHKLETLALEQLLRQLEYRYAAIESELGDIDLEQTALDLKFEAMGFENEKQLQKISNDIASLSKQHLISIVAKTAGRIAGLSVKQGASVNANQPLGQVSSPNTPLVATIYAPSRSAGKIHTEQELLLAFDAFPVSEFGFSSAVVTSISAAPLDPRQTLLPVAGLTEPVFLIQAVLEQHYVEGLDTFALTPGTEFSANFVVEELSLLEFIFKPALKLRGKIL